MYVCDGQRWKLAGKEDEMTTVTLTHADTHTHMPRVNSC